MRYGSNEPPKAPEPIPENKSCKVVEEFKKEIANLDLMMALSSYDWLRNFVEVLKLQGEITERCEETALDHIRTFRKAAIIMDSLAE